MGRLNHVVTGSKNGSVIVAKRQDRKVVTGRPTPTLRTFLIARSVLARLARLLSASHLALRYCHATSAAPSARGAMEQERSGAGMRSRQWLSWPGCPCGGRV